jgi:outer membrane protein TolC
MNIKRPRFGRRIGVCAALLCAALACGARAGELGDLLVTVVQHPTIRATNRQVEAAQMQVEAATGRYYGSAMATAGYHTYEDKRIVGVFAPGRTLASLTSDQISQIGLSYSLPVDVFGVIASSKERAKNDVQAAQLLGRQQVLMKMNQAANAYVTLQSLAKQRDALNQSRKRIESTYERVQAEFKLGKASGVDFKYAESEVARLRADQAILDGATTQVQADIQEATEVAGFTPKSGEISVPAWLPPAQDSLAVQIAKTKQRSAVAQADEARKSLRPSFNLDANYTYNADMASDHRTVWALGGTISIPIGVSQYRQADAQALAAAAAAEQTDAAARDSDRQVASLHSAYDTALADLEAMGKEIAYREEIAHVQQKMQRLGSQTLENLFKHERDLLDARFRQIQAKARAAAAWSAAQIVIGIAADAYITQMDAK